MNKYSTLKNIISEMKRNKFNISILFYLHTLFN